MGGRFQSKVALVTGASSGIGRACALAFAQEGASVLLAARRVEAGRAVEAEIKAAGGTALFQPTDLTRPEDIGHMVDAAVRHYRRLDVLVNAAGINPPGSVTETSLDTWNLVLATNLTAVFLAAKAAIPYLQSTGGAIVSIAGTLGLSAAPHEAAYCASKAGVILLTRQMAMDYGDQGIRVNCVCPGLVDTPLTQGIPSEDYKKLLDHQAVHRAGTPEEIAQAVLYLASDQARFTTGAALVVDGGQQAGHYLDR